MFLQKAETYNRHVLFLDHGPSHPNQTQQQYVTLKEIEERLFTYITVTHTAGFSEQQAHRVRICNDAILQAVTSSKYLKDIQHHIINLKDETISYPIIADSIHFFQELIEKTSHAIQELDTEGNAEAKIATIETHIHALHELDDHYLETLTTNRDTSINAINISEVIKTNRYVLLACEELLKGHISLQKLG